MENEPLKWEMAYFYLLPKDMKYSGLFLEGITRFT